MKVAIVTGGNRGIGKAIALNLAAKGQDVLLTYRSRKEEAEEVVTSIERLGRKAVALQLDLSDTKSFATFAETVKETLQRTWNRDDFDFLVNNGGDSRQAAFTEITEEQFDQLVNVLFKGVFFLTQTLLPLMVDGGRIIIISSAITRVSNPGSSIYGAMKGALEILTHHLALELSSRGITANAVAPGVIETDFADGSIRNENIQQYVKQRTALGRVGQPEDVGGVVAALLSEETRWINGQRIEVTGGFNL